MRRADTAIGAALFAASAGAVLILTATALSGTPLRGHFTDVGAVAHAIGVHLGAGAGAVFAIALLNASLLCAAAVSLSGCYAIAEVFGVKHSLHRSFRDAKAFHASFATIVALAAGVVLLPGLPLGTITTLVQALAGILLPSTLVLLLILCNDEQLLGPLTNGRWLNVTAGAAVAILLALSTLLTITTVLPHVDVEVALLRHHRPAADRRARARNQQSKEQAGTATGEDSDALATTNLELTDAGAGAPRDPDSPAAPRTRAAARVHPAHRRPAVAQARRPVTHLTRRAVVAWHHPPMPKATGPPAEIEGKIRWLDDIADHDYAAAEAYLSLKLDKPAVSRVVGRLRKAPITTRRANDILRAADRSGVRPGPSREPVQARGASFPRS